MAISLGTWEYSQGFLGAPSQKLENKEWCHVLALLRKGHKVSPSERAEKHSEILHTHTYMVSGTCL